MFVGSVMSSQSQLQLHGHVGQDNRLPGSLVFMRRATRPEALYSDSGPGSKEWAPRLPGKPWSEYIPLILGWWVG